MNLSVNLLGTVLTIFVNYTSASAATSCRVAFPEGMKTTPNHENLSPVEPRGSLGRSARSENDYVQFHSEQNHLIRLQDGTEAVLNSPFEFPVWGASRPTGGSPTQSVISPDGSKALVVWSMLAHNIGYSSTQTRATQGVGLYEYKGVERGRNSLEMQRALDLESGRCVAASFLNNSQALIAIARTNGSGAEKLTLKMVDFNLSKKPKTFPRMNLSELKTFGEMSDRNGHILAGEFDQKNGYLAIISGARNFDLTTYPLDRVGIQSLIFDRAVIQVFSIARGEKGTYTLTKERETPVADLYERAQKTIGLFEAPESRVERRLLEKFLPSQRER